MKLVKVQQIEKDSYNLFVMQNEGGSFLQSWEWGQWQEKLGRQVLRYWILNDAGVKVGSIFFVKMPLPLKKYYWYVPYGPLFDLKFRIEDLRFLKQAMQQELVGAVFLRVEPKAIGWAEQDGVKKTKNIQPAKTLIIDLAKSEEQLLTEMHHKTRYNIKVAQKHGVEIKDEFDISIGHGLFFNEAIKLIAETAKRQKFNTFPLGYYKGMTDFFALKNSGEVKLHIYKAIFQNQLLGAAFMIDFGQTRTFLFGGSSEFHKNVMAPYVLHWQAMRDAQGQGMLKYDFWGTETSAGATPGFVRFKLGFGGEEKQYPGAYDFVLNKFLYQTYLGLRRVNKLVKKISH